MTEMPTTIRTDDEVPQWVMRMLAAVAQSTSVALMVAIGAVDSGGAPWGAYLFAAGFGALLLLSRWAPVTVLLVSLAGVFAYYILDYPPIGMAVPVVGAFFAVAERGRLLVAVIAGAVLLAVSLYFRAADGQSSAVLGHELVTNVALIAAAIALAWVVRNRRQLHRQQQQVVALERAQEQHRTARQVEAERLRIARDVHDSLGHALSLVSVQAKVGQQSVGVDDRAVGAALARIATATSASLADLRSTLSVLRSGQDADDHARLSLAGLEDLVQAVRDTGLHVGLDVENTRLAAPVADAAYRIIQEATTNVLRHARAQSVMISVRSAEGRVRIEVTDDGVGPGASESHPGGGRGQGRGLEGMRERAETVGGTFSARSTGPGFVVTAELPVGSTPGDRGRKSGKT